LNCLWQNSLGERSGSRREEGEGGEGGVEIGREEGRGEKRERRERGSDKGS